jgi:hypothetical protein
MNLMNFPLLVLVLSFLVLMFSAWIGDYLRRREGAVTEEARDDFSTVVGATLTLLGLIIGFSFSMAIGRYDQRKNYEEEEANAIGTEYLRADLLPGETTAKVHALLKKYIDQRLLFYTTRDPIQLAKVNADTADLQNQLWSALLQGRVQDTPVYAVVVSGMNDVLNSQGYTQAAWWNRIPIGAWGLLAAIAIGSNFLIGFGVRRSDRRIFLVIPVAVSIALFLIADIDSPRGGAIRVKPQNLISLEQSLPAQ